MGKIKREAKTYEQEAKTYEGKSKQQEPETKISGPEMKTDKPVNVCALPKYQAFGGGGGGGGGGKRREGGEKKERNDPIPLFPLLFPLPLPLRRSGTQVSLREKRKRTKGKR